MLHGGPGLSSGYLLPQMSNFGNGYKVIFYDQRGSGKSSDTQINEQTITMAQFIADLDAVRAKLGYNKIILMGHSWGGLLAMNYAIAHPAHVEDLVLVNSAPATHAGFLEFVQEYDKRTAKINHELNSMRDSAAFRAGDPSVVTKYYRLIFATYMTNPKDVDKISLYFTNKSALNGFKVAAILQKNYFDNKYDVLPQLKKLHIPTLIIHGSDDLMPLATDEAIQKAIPNAKLIILNHTGHFAYIEDPANFFADVKAFLNQNQNTH
ncbi:MAG TPA: alpha/beta fold hydrolase [Gammaproteobacteria bacterium]|nr:alpha/beta fold hydrolase [Gammaproteobacteria bacterium]